MDRWLVSPLFARMPGEPQHRFSLWPRRRRRRLPRARGPRRSGLRRRRPGFVACKGGGEKEGKGGAAQAGRALPFGAMAWADRTAWGIAAAAAWVFASKGKDKEGPVQERANR